MKDSLIRSAISLVTGSISCHQRPVILTCTPNARLFRFDPKADEGGRDVTLSQLLEYQRRCWRPVGDLNELLSDCDAALQLKADDQELQTVSCTHLAAFAYGWARLLVEQMHAVSDDVTPVPDLRELRAACCNAIAGMNDIKEAAAEVIQSVSKTIKPDRSQCEGRPMPAMLFVGSDRGQIYLKWQDDSGDEIATETLDMLIGRMARSSLVDDSLRKHWCLRKKYREQMKEGHDLVDRSCPSLREPIRHAIATREITGYTVCPRATVGGLPAQVRLYIDPGGRGAGRPAVHLVALRACEEFILQSFDGHSFYFPPVQLHAQITFTPSESIWSLPNPRIRMPERGAKWLHPYSGPLEDDRFSSASFFPHEPTEPIVAPSSHGRIFLQRSNSTYSRASSNDMCLTNQDSTLEKIRRTIRNAEQAGANPNLLAAVWSLWDIVSVGLTHGHVDNRDRPRANLDLDTMIYSVGDIACTKGDSLAKRVYPFSTKSPAVARHPSRTRGSHERSEPSSDALLRALERLL